jgi:hypothetical protein
VAKFSIGVLVLLFIENIVMEQEQEKIKELKAAHGVVPNAIIISILAARDM